MGLFARLGRARRAVAEILTAGPSLGEVRPHAPDDHVPPPDWERARARFEADRPALNAAADRVAAQIVWRWGGARMHAFPRLSSIAVCGYAPNPGDGAKPDPRAACGRCRRVLSGQNFRPSAPALHGGRCAAQGSEPPGRFYQCSLAPGHEGAHLWGVDNQITEARPFA